MAIDANPSLRGSAVGLFLFDVCEEMRLDEVRSILGARRLGEGLKHAAGEQLFFERPPVVEDAQFPGEVGAKVRIKYYDYGVLSVLFEFPFAGEWPDLISLSSRWISGTDLPNRAAEIRAGKSRARAPRHGKALPEVAERGLLHFLCGRLPAIQP